MSAEDALHLFEATGVELEYMIVDRDSLDVLPIADRLILAESGTYDSEIERGEIAWSNELALHVVELKTNGPTADLAAAAERFQGEVRYANELLGSMNAVLMPGAAHPWMDPDRELRLWPHEYNPIYETYNRIFDCRGHGWANLQSMHVNLPFDGDEEFSRLHAAIRFLLPIMPALAASSPVLDGVPTGLLDSRLDAYRGNADRVPSVAGLVVPEPATSREEYERNILGRIYADMGELDPQGVLRHEWVNSRGCIARFDRMAIEIRVLDVQECPAADLAVASAIIAVLRSLTDGGGAGPAVWNAFPTERLADLLGAVIRDGDGASIADAEYAALLGARSAGGLSALDLWARLIDDGGARAQMSRPCRQALGVILEQGCLARRLLRRIGEGGDRDQLREIYRDLTGCLGAGRSFLAEC